MADLQNGSLLVFCEVKLYPEQGPAARGGHGVKHDEKQLN